MSLKVKFLEKVSKKVRDRITTAASRKGADLGQVGGVFLGSYVLNAPDHTNFFEGKVTEYTVGGLIGKFNYDFVDEVTA